MRLVRLLFIMVAFTPLLSAATVQVKIAGYVKTGTDTTNVFGYGTNYHFTDAEPFTLIYTFDDSIGAQSVSYSGSSPDYSIVQGNTGASGNGSPATSAVLTIGSNSWTWNSYPTNYRSSSTNRWAYPSANNNMNVNATDDYEVGGSGPGSTLGSATVSGTLYPASGTLTSNYDWRVAIPSTAASTSRTMSFSIGRITRGTPVVYQTASGTLEPHTLEVDGPPCNLPIGETTISVAQDPVNLNLTKFGMSLTPLAGSASQFSGMSVREQPGNAGADGCYAASAYSGGPFNAITGGTWVVNSSGNYQYDSIGYSPGEISYYRGELVVPCGTYIYQQMQMQCSDGTWWPYGTQNTGNQNTLQANIQTTTISAARAGNNSGSEPY